MNFTDLDAYSKRLLYASLYLWLFKPGPFIGLGRGQTGDPRFFKVTYMNMYL